MRILTVWDGDYPWDVRVEKICRTLIAEGHETHLVCRNSKGLVRRETINGIQVRRIFSLSGKLSRLNGLITFPVFFSPSWKEEIEIAVADINPDIVIIRDLPIALAVFPATKSRGIPTVLDMAECYPEMIRCAWKFERFSLLNALIRNPFLADLVEKITLQKIDLAWVMVEESAHRLTKKGLPAAKIRIVSNTPRTTSQPIERSRKAPGPLQILYVGLINPSRGIKTLVEAASLIRKNFEDFYITIVGSGKDFSNISSLIDRLELHNHIVMTGWINQDELAPLYDKADIGIVPHYRCSHWDNTIPNKLFDYMKAGIPVVVSDATPMKRIIEETNAGLVYQSFNAEELAHKILDLRDAEVRLRLGANGTAAIQRKYNWDKDSSVMLESLSSLAVAHSN